MEYSRSALGEVIRDLREAHTPKLSQEELGRQAGYRTGAGVSMSRIENGLTRPGPRRLSGIARALGTTVHELETRSAQRTDPTSEPRTAAVPGVDHDRDHESLKQRMRRIQGEYGRRQTQAVAHGHAFNDAHDRARDEFFLALVEASRGVSGLPTIPDVRPAQEQPASEAVTRHQVAAAGLTAALASGTAARVVGAETDGEAAYSAVVAAAMLAPVPGGRPDAGDEAEATTRATRALLGSGGTMSGRTGIAAAVVLLGGFVASAGSPLIAAGALAWVARRSRQQNDQLRLELDQAESNLTATQAGFGAVMDLLSDATELLGYIAVHAGHALARWRAARPEHPVRWTELGPDQQRAYRTFVDIAAHQVCVDSINMTELLAAPAAQQATLVDAARAILVGARREVERLV